jgi:DNA-binding CsgD family transcriptional regulator
MSALAGAGLDVDTFSQAACELLRQAVPFDWACLARTDPATQLITGVVKVDLPQPRDAEFTRYEYGVDDVNTFAEIARRATPVGVLHLDTDGRPERSARWREFYLPHFGPAHELRAALRAGVHVWGLLAVYRGESSSGFSPAEADFVAGVAHAMAAGMRAGLVAAAGRATTVDVDGPAVIVVGPDDEVRQVTPGAEQRLVELGGEHRRELPVPLLSIIGAARAFGAGQAHWSPRARVRVPSGEWLVVHAAPLAGPDGARGDVVLTVEPARPPEIVPLVVAALGLTAREQDVVRLVLAGADTAEIARTLHLSPYTVQDHLKSVFDKAGVSSRRELTARVFLEHYAPRVGSAAGPDGWFAS